MIKILFDLNVHWSEDFPRIMQLIQGSSELTISEETWFPAG